jgi:hypothetical protein
MQIMRDIASAVAGQQDGDTRATTVEQEWHEGTRQCPIGSIPILRTKPSVTYPAGLLPSPLRAAAANFSGWSSAADAAGPRYEVSLLGILILCVTCVYSDRFILPSS